ncbi:TPA: pre-toxin TG domain-containing protein [Streptococcus suis]|uniref:pre-toxin TG domain-containing protein n=1 Tax=Streptococcus suis TaxID=1307 RepID=UPI000CF5C0F4|nr:pre-toxin TG domain-containing protein [Streptococcus suis]HEM5111551.1 pre-toxin TG domain-containing protein [Streptococcus suis]HEM6556956.1 pre-toxin TG domain-containing protein [Streptococcus suis]HEM6590543.1 pre-toxin TG domain-containing protein [Streptococcus suis]
MAGEFFYVNDIYRVITGTDPITGEKASRLEAAAWLATDLISIGGSKFGKLAKPYAGTVLLSVARRLISLNYRIPYPHVRSYEELREVLEENISLYLEFFEALKKYQ